MQDDGLERNPNWMNMQVEQDLNMPDYKKKSVGDAIPKLEEMLRLAMMDSNDAYAKSGDTLQSYYWLCEKLTKAIALCEKITQFYGIQEEWKQRSEKMKQMHADGTLASAKQRKKELKEKPHD